MFLCSLKKGIDLCYCVSITYSMYYLRFILTSVVGVYIFILQTKILCITFFFFFCKCCS